MPAFMIAAAHKSSGKTVISTALVAALSARGNHVQSFKKGPDYIDPMWLSAASGQPCYNLDFNTMSPDELRQLFEQKSAGADVALVEANKGLFDGIDLQGADCNAQLAKLLNLAVILVIDTNGITRGIAPLLQGYQGFDPQVNIAGVILNKVGGQRHEDKLVAAVRAYTDIEVLGSVHRNSRLDIGERHLGLTTPGETGELEKTIAGFSEIIGQSIDLERLLEVAEARGQTVEPVVQGVSTRSKAAPHLRIGIIRDVAFGFYYADDLEAFGNAGAELIEIDAINDPNMPPLDGLFIGGGFPEMFGEALAENHNLKADIKSAIEAGLPTYAECGGLMYLCRSLTFKGKSYPMVGVIEADAVMHKRAQGRGYASFSENSCHPWRMAGRSVAHEFHYASLKNIEHKASYLRQITKGHGIDGAGDAIGIHNLVAGFCHLRNTKQNPWVNRFVKFVETKKRS